jgi:hypothetical protein
MIQLIYTPDRTGTQRASGHATVDYWSDYGSERVIETTKADLVAVFKQANEDGHTLGGVDDTMQAAIDSPLKYRDYLILTDAGEIAFDPDYTRSKPSQ